MEVTRRRHDHQEIEFLDRPRNLDSARSRAILFYPDRSGRARGQDVSPRRPSLQTPTTMMVPVTVHDSVIYCTNYNIDEAPRPTQAFAWAQASRANERAPIYGLEVKTSDHTNVFQDVRTAFGTGTPAAQQTGFGRAPVAPFVPESLSEIPRVDNSHFRFCDYLQRSV